MKWDPLGMLFISALAIMTANCSLNSRIYGLDVVESNTSTTPSEGTSPELCNLSYSVPVSFFKELEPVNLIPTKTSTCSEFQVSPALPNGLAINLNSGVVAGTANAAALRQVYSVSAKGPNGALTTTTLEFEVARFFLVNTTNDTIDASLGNGVCSDSVGLCSLRAALEEAKALGANQLTYIEIPAGDYGVDTLPLSIESRVILKGAGVSSVALNGNKDGTPVVNVVNTTAAADDVSIEGVTIKNASVSSSGGFVSGLGLKSVSKNLTLKDCAIRDNSVTASNLAVIGIGLNHSSSGTLKITNCLITNNAMTAGSPTSGVGAGLYVIANTISIRDSEISSNLFPQGAGGSTGGGASLTATDSIDIEKTLVTLNQSRNHSAGLLLSGKSNITNSKLINNNGPSSIFGNEIYITGAFICTLTNSLVQVTGVQQAIFTSGGTLNFVNSTISTGSTAVYNTNSQVNFQSSTLVVSSIPAFSFSGGNTTGNISFKNSIFKFSGSFHIGATNPSYSSLGYNVFSNSGFPVGTHAATDLLSTDPLLDVLANNGGPTQTMSLQASSPAKNLIPVAICMASDQRGQSRTAGTHCDAGAYQH